MGRVNEESGKLVVERSGFEDRVFIRAATLGKKFSNVHFLQNR